MKKICFILSFSILISTLFVGNVSAAQILQEDFESGTFSQEWTVVTDKNPVAVSEEKAHGGTYSAKIGKNSVQRYAISLTQKTVSIWLYDDESYDKTCGVIKLTDGDKGIIFGVYTSASPTEYVYREGPAGSTWVRTGVQRSTGWHKLTLDFTGSKVKLFVDDIEAVQISGYSRFDGIEIGDYWAQLEKELYMDDLEVSDEPYAGGGQQGEENPQETPTTTPTPTATPAPTATPSTQPAQNGGYQDVSGNLVSVTNVLSGLGIIEGYTDGTFRPDSDVTRAEFATIMVKAMGYAGWGAELAATPFSDVDQSKWYSGYVNVAERFGLIHGFGDGTFRPEDKITYHEAIKMVVSALGYGELARVRGGYPSGYVIVASEIQLLKRIPSYNGEDNITRAAIANMVYNALEIDLMQMVGVGEQNEYKTVKGENLLTENLNLNRVTGILRAVEYDSIVYGEKAGDKKIILNDERYHMETAAQASDLLGYEVDCYIGNGVDDENQVFLAVKSKRNNETIVYAKDVVSAETGGTIKYEDDNGKAERLNMDSDTEVLYNGKVLYQCTDQDLMPDNGTMTFIDNDGDGSYEVVLIRSFETVVVESKNSETETVTNRLNGESYLLDERKLDVLEILKDGKPMSFSQIKDDDVLCIYRDRENTKAVVEVVDSKISGAVTDLDGEEYIVVNGTTYRLSKAFQDWMASEETRPTNQSVSLNAGDSYEIFLDKDGEVAYLTLMVAKQKYGYLIQADLGGRGVNNSPQVKIMTDSGEIQLMDFARRVELNHTTVDSGSLRASSELFAEPQLIKYELNANGEIRKFDTAQQYQQGGVIGEDYLTLNKQYTDIEKARYKSPSRALCANSFVGVAEPGQTPEYLLAANAVIFRIRLEDDGTVDEELSGVTSNIANDSQLVCNVYDANSANEAKALEIIMTSSADGESDIYSNIVVDRITKVVDADMEESYRLYGWQDGVMAQFNNVTAPNIDKIQKLDVVRLKENVRGEIHSIEKVNDGQLGKIRLSASKYFVKGIILSKENGVIRVAYSDDGASDSYRIDAVENITKISREDKEVVRTDQSELRPSTEGTMDGSYVMIGVNNFNVSDILIME